MFDEQTFARELEAHAQIIGQKLAALSHEGVRCDDPQFIRLDATWGAINAVVEAVRLASPNP